MSFMIRKMKQYKFIWLDGKIEYGDGVNVADALERLGYYPDEDYLLDTVIEIKQENNNE